MNRTAMLALGTALFLLAAGCATNYRNDFDPGADFSSFKTYGYLAPKEIEDGGLLSNSLSRKRVEAMLSRQLDGRGLKQVPLAKGPDLEVLYWVGVQEKQQVSTVPSRTVYRPSYGYDPGYRYPLGYGLPSAYPYYTGGWETTYNEVMVSNYREGTLIVDLIDARTKNLVWRTYLVRALYDDPDANLRGAEKDLEKAFAEFPPSEEAKRKKLR